MMGVLADATACMLIFQVAFGSNVYVTWNVDEIVQTLLCSELTATITVPGNPSVPLGSRRVKVTESEETLVVSQTRWSYPFVPPCKESKLSNSRVLLGVQYNGTIRMQVLTFISWDEKFVGTRRIFANWDGECPVSDSVCISSFDTKS